MPSVILESFRHGNTEYAHRGVRLYVDGELIIEGDFEDRYSMEKLLIAVAQVYDKSSRMVFTTEGV